ncbi:MAG: LysM peptidoglycan-binding domain-containing protein [Anaerolineales bacterium]|nr:LysM peptidoglycan-binding domain-containing protein [Anaerolineales bacterium]
MNPLKKLSLTFLVALMLLSMFAASITPASAATVTNCTQWHVVQSGEYLSQIAKNYNTTVAKLIEINELDNPNLIFVGQNLCVSVSGTPGTPAPTLPNTNAGVRVSATSVTEDVSVTLSGKFLVANSTYTISLSNYKANQPISYVVGTVTAKSDGTFSATFSLPNKLADVSKLKVVISNGKGDTASNWFYNITSSGNTGGIGSPVLTLSVVSVDKGESVKIQASNLLPGVTYQVLMGKTGTAGVDGIVVGTIKGTKSGTVTATFEVPTELEGRSKIDLRVENNPFEASAYVTFQND